MATFFQIHSNSSCNSTPYSLATESTIKHPILCILGVYCQGVIWLEHEAGLMPKVKPGSVPSEEGQGLWWSVLLTSLFFFLPTTTTCLYMYLSLGNEFNLGLCSIWTLWHTGNVVMVVKFFKVWSFMLAVVVGINCAMCQINIYRTCLVDNGFINVECFVGKWLFFHV